jgi:hypothetical protein
MANDGIATPTTNLIEQILVSHGVTVTCVTAVVAAVRKMEHELMDAVAKIAMDSKTRKEKNRIRQAKHRAKNCHSDTRDMPTIYNSSNSSTTLSKKKVFKEVRKKDGKNLHRGHALPNDWKPKEAHYAQGVKLGFDRQTIDGFAERMRNWAEANQHRQVARKSNWDAAFRNWVSGAAERNGGGNNGKVTAHHGAFGFDELAARLERGQGNGAGDSVRHAAGHEHGSGCYDSEERVERLAGSGQTSLFASRSHR